MIFCYIKALLVKKIKNKLFDSNQNIRKSTDIK